MLLGPGGLAASSAPATEPDAHAAFNDGSEVSLESACRRSVTNGDAETVKCEAPVDILISRDEPQLVHNLWFLVS